MPRILTVFMVVVVTAILLFFGLSIQSNSSFVASLDQSLEIYLPKHWHEIAIQESGEQLAKAIAREQSEEQRQFGQSEGIVLRSRENTVHLLVPHGFEVYEFNLGTGCWELPRLPAFSRRNGKLSFSFEHCY